MRGVVWSPTRCGAWVAALIACGASWGSAASEARAEDETEFAQRHFERGLELYDRGDHADALVSFETSYELAPSPNSLLFVARTLRELGRSVEAAEAFGRTAREARARAADEPRYAPTAEAAEAERRALLSAVGRVVLRLDGGWTAVEVTVAGRSIPEEALGLPVIVEPGAVAVVARTADGRVVRRTVDAEAGREIEVRLEVGTARSDAPAQVVAGPTEPEEVPPQGAVRWTGPAGWSSLALGAAGWITLTVFGLLASERFDDLEERCGGPCPPSLGDDVDQGRLYQTLANVGLALGVVGTGVGLGLLLLVQDDEGAAEAGGGGARLGLRLLGTF